MDELGNILRDAREMKGLTLAEVQEQIKINARYLDALEESQYQELPTPVHVRGFLRNYARFLDLDPDPLLERYEAGTANRSLTAVASNSSGRANASPENPLTTRPDQPFFEPVNMDLNGNVGGTESRVRLVIIVALLATIALAASRFVPLLLGQGNGPENLPQMIESFMSEDVEPGVDLTPTVSESNVPAVTSEPVVPSERNNPAGAATDEAAAAGATATRQPLPATMEQIDLQLDITERTWVRVTIDGEVVLEDQVTREDSPFQWQAQQEAHLLTGNAAGVFISINDIEVGRLGSRGEVAEQTWTTTGN
jgi:cytoskeletal protein RodZ